MTDIDGSSTEAHPVWQLYDEIRTARLNVKYFGELLRIIERNNLLMEVALALTAPSSAIAVFALWRTEYGKIIWAAFGVAAATISIIKPFLKYSSRIKEIDRVIQGYRQYEHELESLKNKIEQDQAYGKVHMDKFQKIHSMKRNLRKEEPTREKLNQTVLREMQIQVQTELPLDRFFIPGKS